MTGVQSCALPIFVGADLSRVVYTVYGNPAQRGVEADGSPLACDNGKHGFDVHPAFSVNGARAQKAVEFVEGKFVPALETLATCDRKPGSPIAAGCVSASDKMRFVKAHRAQFMEHSFCAAAETDPDFDKACFRANGDSFRDVINGAALRCGRDPNAWRTYASRARWWRTPNDSYFAAMTFPSVGGLLSKPSNLHDGLWGLYAGVYGGAIHPTAEGHAAMADAALPELAAALGVKP